MNSRDLNAAYKLSRILWLLNLADMSAIQILSTHTKEGSSDENIQQLARRLLREPS